MTFNSSNFSAYSVFLPKIFVYKSEQRFKYWIENLGFFLSEKIYDKKSLLKKNLGRKHLISFYFNMRKYFFSFLLLKLFLNYNFSKFLASQSENLVKTSPINLAQSIYHKQNSSSTANNYVPSSRNKVVNSKIQTLTFKKTRVLFFSTTPVQKLFIDNVFKNFKHLNILLEKNLITNRQFFYKMLFGFHKERKNFAYPQVATRLNKPAKSFFLNWGFNLILNKINNFFFKTINKKIVFNDFLLKFFSKTRFLVFLRRFKVITSKFCFKNNFFSYKNKKKIIFCFYNFYFFLIKTFFTTSLSFFLGLFWIKNFFTDDFLNKNSLTWRNFLLNFANSKLPAKNFFFFESNFFFDSIKFFFNKHFLLLFNSLNSLTTFNLNNTKNRLTPHVFSEKIFTLADNNKLKTRQSLMNKIMLLKFLPISLVVLFISSANKQALRDVFRMNIPFILISSIENPNKASDYSFPGNSFEFNILYFYMKFLLDLLKTAV